MKIAELAWRRIRSKTLQQFADRIMVAGGKKRQASSLGTENEPGVQTCATLEIVLAQATNSEPRMKVRFPKSVADGIDCARYLAPARFWEFPDIPPKCF